MARKNIYIPDDLAKRIPKDMNLSGVCQAALEAALEVDPLSKVESEVLCARTAIEQAEGHLRRARQNMKAKVGA